jgi:LysR family transcriptional regulator, hypochlorite-specific transcription factor HypT
VRLEWLEDILAVAQTGSFTEAAERRFVTQSAFSRRIQQIEDHVGVELFDRTRKPVQLRPTTEAQRARIEELTDALRQLVGDLKQGAKLSANRIMIVSQHALTATMTSLIIERAQRTAPDASFRLRSANLDECLTQLFSRQADIAVVYRLPGSSHSVRSDFVEAAVIGDERLVPVLAANRVAWLLERLAAGELPFISYPADVFLGQVMERAVLARLRRDLRLEARVETALTFASCEMALAGVAPAWVPMSLARRAIEEGRLADLSDHLPACDLEVTVIRLLGATGGLERDIWRQLTDRSLTLGETG